MGILDELGKQRSNIDTERLREDLKSWLNEIKAKTLMIESALMTLDAYFKEDMK